MALSKSSKILVSDINTALSNKQDKLSYTPVKSVNGTTADSSGNVAISVSAPVTSVNGMTGAVTINVAGTKVNNAGYADSAGSANITPNVKTGYTSSTSFTLPSGGTWTYFARSGMSGAYDVFKCGSASGGKQITPGEDGNCYWIALRTA